MPREQTWTNKDGLIVGFGTHTADNNVPAVTSEVGAVKTMQMLITGTLLGSTASATGIPPQSVRIKRGSIIQASKFVVQTPFTSGGSATLTIGTYKADDVSTVDDDDGIDATIALTAIDAAGETVVNDGALVNGTVPVGATSDSDVQIVAHYGTAAFTAGVGILTITYIEPSYNLSIAA